MEGQIPSHKYNKKNNNMNLFSRREHKIRFFLVVWKNQ